MGSRALVVILVSLTGVEEHSFATGPCEGLGQARRLGLGWGSGKHVFFEV